MPSIRLDLYHARWPEMEINVRNKGGSPVALASIQMTISFVRENVKPGNYTWILKFPDRNGDMIGTSGPALPFTIPGYHSQKWTFDSARLEQFWYQVLSGSTSASITITSVIIEAELATGRVVMKRLRPAGLRRVKPPLNLRPDASGTSEPDESGT
jgi:hypothetical protein